MYHPNKLDTRHPGIFVLEFLKENHFFLITLQHIVVIFVKFLLFSFILWWCRHCVKIEIQGKFLKILNQICLYTCMSPFKPCSLRQFLHVFSNITELHVVHFYQTYLCLIFSCNDRPFWLISSSLLHSLPKSNQY